MRTTLEIILEDSEFLLEVKKECITKVKIYCNLHNKSLGDITEHTFFMVVYPTNSCVALYVVLNHSKDMPITDKCSVRKFDLTVNASGFAYVGSETVDSWNWYHLTTRAFNKSQISVEL